MDLTEEIKDSIIFYALNELLERLKDSDIENLTQLTPLKSFISSPDKDSSGVS